MYTLKVSTGVLSKIILQFFLQALFLCTVATAQKLSRPNILWIVCEDMSPEHLGCYGGTGGKTPNIDKLARESVQYTRVYYTAGVCAPSRAALITGAYQTSIGAQHM